MNGKNNRAEMAWTGDVNQLANNLEKVQAATGKNIPKISGGASDAFEKRLSKLYYSNNPKVLIPSQELYSKVLEKKLGGRWKISITVKEGTGTDPIKNPPKFAVEAVRAGD